MNVFEEAKRAMSQGIEFLAGFDRQAALDAGFASHWVNEWNKARETYFGRTRCKKQQRRAVDKAKGVPLNQLLLIENRIAHVEDEMERWRLRHRLLELRGNYESLKRQVREFVPPKEKKAPKKGVRFHAPVNGMRSYTVTDDEREVTDVETHISHDLDPGRPEAEQKLERLRRVLRGDGGVPRAVPRPIVVVPVDEAIKIKQGRGDDTILHLTDGTTMTCSEFVAEQFGEELEVAVFHPQEGPVNLLRGQRFANAKQRALIKMTQPICAVPGCRHAADMCEMHHIDPWKNGGETNVNNLAPLCRYHNRVNDDDHQGVRGRIEWIRGRPVWVSPRGYPVRNTRQPHGAMELLFGP